MSHAADETFQSQRELAHR